jgi:hypothetical protein
VTVDRRETLKSKHSPQRPELAVIAQPPSTAPARRSRHIRRSRDIAIGHRPCRIWQQRPRGREVGIGVERDLRVGCGEGGRIDREVDRLWVGKSGWGRRWIGGVLGGLTVGRVRGCEVSTEMGDVALDTAGRGIRDSSITTRIQATASPSFAWSSAFAHHMTRRYQRSPSKLQSRTHLLRQ